MRKGAARLWIFLSLILFVCGASAADDGIASSGARPAGVSGDVQFKGATSNFDADHSFNYNKNTKTLTVTTINSPSISTSTFISTTSAAQLYFPLTSSTTLVSQSSATINLMSQSSTTINFVSQSSASLNLVSQSSASLNLVSQSSATNNLVSQSSVSLNYVSQSSASLNLVSQSSASLNLMSQSSSTLNCVSQSSAALNLLSQSVAAQTYFPSASSSTLVSQSSATTNLVPYNGATSNIDVGVYGIKSTVSTSTYYGDGTNLTGVMTQSSATINRVPYSGANADVNLGAYKISAGTVTAPQVNVSSMGTVAQIKWTDGTIQISSPPAGGAGGGPQKYSNWVNPTQVTLSSQSCQMSNSTGSWSSSLLCDDTINEFVWWNSSLYPYQGGGLKFKINYDMVSTTTVNVTFWAAVACISPGDAVDVDSKAYAVAASTTGQTPGTAKYPSALTISITDDSCAQGDMIGIKFGRIGITGQGDVDIRQSYLYEP